MILQRVLGRDAYSEREKLAWSIILATEGIEGLVDALINSEEYQTNFGEDIVPYQRRRILPQGTQGELPFARMPRYGADYRAKLEAIGYFSNQTKDYPWMNSTPYFPPKQVMLAGKIITLLGAGFLAFVTFAVALAAWGIISL